jgi:DNA-binding HxlR family transcriptional regulator
VGLFSHDRLVVTAYFIVRKTNYPLADKDRKVGHAVASKRTYGDRCGVARALDLVGERWALLVVRELLLGPKRFTDLRAGLPNMSPDVLAQRLRELESGGIVQRRRLAPPAGSQVYELTDWGSELEPVVLQLGRWGSQAPFPPGDAELGVDSFVLALKTLFAPSAAGELDATYELRFGEHVFHVRVAEGGLELGRGSADAPEAAIETDPTTLSRVLWHGHLLADALRSGEVTMEGDPHSVALFLRLFPAPEPAGAVAELAPGAGH